MKVQILVPALIAIMSVTACAPKGKSKSAKVEVPQVTASGEITKQTVEVNSTGEAKSTGEQAPAAEQKAAVETPKLIEPIGTDGQCTPEFIKTYALIGSKSAAAAKSLDQALTKMLPILKGDKLNDGEIGDVTAAWNTFSAVQKEFSSTIRFPFTCWLPTDSKAKMQITSEQIEATGKLLKQRATAAVGSQNIK